LRNKRRIPEPPKPATKLTEPAPARQSTPGRGHPRWEKGQSGNPKGRVKGSRNWATTLAEQLLNRSAQRVVTALITAAEKGDTAAACFVVRRLLPVRHGYPIQFNLPPITTASDVVAALSVIAQQMSEGRLTVEEASAAVNVLETSRKAIETVDIERRLAAVEKAQETQRR
jgi:hypothetical protein